MRTRQRVPLWCALCCEVHAAARTRQRRSCHGDLAALTNRGMQAVADAAAGLKEEAGGGLRRRALAAIVPLIDNVDVALSALQIEHGM